jgi:hypothetical protein
MSCPLEPPRCACRCGYTCGGPGLCLLSPFNCLDAGHFVKDCEHDFSGPLVHISEGMQSVVCQKCKLSAMDHDCQVGP